MTSFVSQETKEQFAKWNSYIQTYSGKRFYPFRPEPHMICIEDISHALSMLCRFGGHCLRYYSVAEHSVYVADLLKDESPIIQMHGLLHDGTEGYLVDLPRPIKRNIPEYNEVESLIWVNIADKFGLSMQQDLPQIKAADNIILCDEIEQIMRPSDLEFDTFNQKASGTKIQCLSPEQAKAMFMKKFYEIAEKIGPEYLINLR